MGLCQRSGHPAVVLVAALMLCLQAGAADPPAVAAGKAPGERQAVRVGTMPIAGAIEWTGDRPTGVMIDVWEDIAGRLGITSEFVRLENFAALLESPLNGRADIALGPIAITEEREKLLDLTHPVFHSGLRIAVRHRNETGFLAAFTSLVSWDLLRLFGLVVLLAVISGHLLWLCERHRNPHSFPSGYPRGVGEAIWWIASTIITGGCDDKHVDSGVGRILAFSWMIGGIVLVAAFTSALTATMTAERVTGMIHSPRDLAGRTVGCQQMGVTVQSVRQRGGIAQEFPLITDALDALELGLVDAVVAESQSLMFLVTQRNRPDVRLVGVMFDAFDFGMGLPPGSPLREDLNTAILRMREDGTLDRIRSEWLGTHD